MTNISKVFAVLGVSPKGGQWLSNFLSEKRFWPNSKHVFETGAFGHSATSPGGAELYRDK
jgi:hypothetical protein